jgi:hypothetical protein
MAENLTLRYDSVGDILYIGTRAAHEGQRSEDIGDEIIARMNPDTGDIENIEILFFSRRLADGETFEIPVHADLRVVAGT